MGKSGGENPHHPRPPDETSSDNRDVLIPAGLPSGNYQPLIGPYNLTNPNTRLPIRTETGTTEVYSMAMIPVK